jgi:hypothetical protein
MTLAEGVFAAVFIGGCIGALIYLNDLEDDEW